MILAARWLIIEDFTAKVRSNCRRVQYCLGCLRGKLVEVPVVSVCGLRASSEGGPD
jgi:hypothetical protein